MDEREILEIAAENWLNRPSANEAAVTAYSEIGRKILGKLIGKLGRPVTQEDWEVLLRMNEAKSRMSYFRRLGPTSIMDEFQIISFLFLLDAWESANQYLYDHYDDARLETKELKKASSKEDLKEIMSKVTALVQAHISALAEDGQVRIPLGEFEMMEQTFGGVMLFILGRNGFEIFASEFNKALPILKRVLSELSLRSKKTKLSPNKNPVLFCPQKNRTIN